jgi:hypothetical protein
VEKKGMTPSEPTDGPTGEPASDPTSIPAQSPQSPKSAAKPKKRRLWLKLGVPLVLVAIAAAGLWVWGTLGFVYSSGERTGYVKGFAQRGWLCKTWEGELTVPRRPALADTTFKFTVRDDSVARALQLAVPGRLVTLSFDEHRGVPSSCFGETENYVRGFRIQP